MKNLFVRTASGTIYVIIFLGSLLLGKYTAGLLLLALSLIALSEFYRISFSTGTNPFSLAGFILNTVIVAITFLVCAGILNKSWLVVSVPLLIMLFVFSLYSRKPEVIKDLATTVLGIVYITLPISLMNYLLFPAVSGNRYTWHILLGILLLNWINDTGAYLVGSAIGRHKLFERLSPKKSWEGAFGGTIFTLVLGYFLFSFLKILTVFDWMILAMIVSVFGIYGDMFESMLKRNADMKDSGKVIPGHGGVLDRIDSILMVIPVAFCYLILLHL